MSMNDYFLMSNHAGHPDMFCKKHVLKSIKISIRSCSLFFFFFDTVDSGNGDIMFFFSGDLVRPRDKSIGILVVETCFFF